MRPSSSKLRYATIGFTSVVLGSLLTLQYNSTVPYLFYIDTIYGRKYFPAYTGPSQLASNPIEVAPASQTTRPPLPRSISNEMILKTWQQDDVDREEYHLRRQEWILRAASRVTEAAREAEREFQRRKQLAMLEEEDLRPEKNSNIDGEECWLQRKDPKAQREEK